MSGSGSSGTGAPSNQRFTSYDRSEDTGLDYAVNRTYNSGQSRFTTVDPIGMASASIGDPQSLNLFAYVTNNPVDFVDPSGLETYNCTVTKYRYGFSQTEEGAQYWYAWQCELEQSKGSGGGSGKGSSGRGGAGIAEPREGIDQNCITALRDLGVWEKVEELLLEPPIIDIDGFLGLPRLGLGKQLPRINDLFSIAGDRASDWVGEYSDFEGQTLGDWFDSGFSDAITVRGSTKVDAIYYRSSIYNLPNDTYLLLHELTHLAFPPEITRDGLNLDEVLMIELDLKKRGNEEPSDTVSRFFNSGCDPNQRFGNDDDEYN